jgi:hypothetical protein
VSQKFCSKVGTASVTASRLSRFAQSMRERRGRAVQLLFLFEERKKVKVLKEELLGGKCCLESPSVGCSYLLSTRRQSIIVTCHLSAV